jgi:hypothetical protein
MMLNYVRLTCVLALSAAAACAQTAPIPSSVLTTGMVGIADAQTAQLNLLNPGVLAPAVGGICNANVAFVDANGTALKTATLAVTPGKSLSFDLRSDTDLALVAGDRREIRATISLPGLVPPPTATGAAPLPVTPGCKLIPTLELFDTVSGKTLVTLGHVTTVPDPVALPTATP